MFPFASKSTRRKAEVEWSIPPLSGVEVETVSMFPLLTNKMVVPMSIEPSFDIIVAQFKPLTITCLETNWSV